MYQLGSTIRILSIQVYPQSGYLLVYQMGLSLVHCSYLSIGLLQEDLGCMHWKEELESLKQKGKELPKQWSISSGLLYYQDRLFISTNENLQTLIAKGCHNSQVAGHFRQEKSLEIITQDFYCKGLTDWVNNYVCSCTACQQAKSPQHARFGLLNPLQVPTAAWASTSVDLIT